MNDLRAAFLWVFCACWSLFGSVWSSLDDIWVFLGSGALALEFFWFRCLYTRVIRFSCLLTRVFAFRCPHTRLLSSGVLTLEFLGSDAFTLQSWSSDAFTLIQNSQLRLLKSDTLNKSNSHHLFIASNPLCQQNCVHNKKLREKSLNANLKMDFKSRFFVHMFVKEKNSTRIYS